MFRNNNQKVIHKIAKASLLANKRKNVMMIAAICLSAFMIFCIFTVGGTWFQMKNAQDIRLNGGQFDAWLYGGFTKEQKIQCETSKNVEAVGAAGFCAYGEKTQYDDTLHTIFKWADQTYWNKIQKSARTTMKGYYPEKENEVLVTKDALKDCGFKNLGIGDSFQITYVDAKGSHTKKFVISGLWDGYGEKTTFYISKAFFDHTGYRLSDYGRGFLYVKFKSPIVTGKMQNELRQRMHLGEKQSLMFTGDTAQSVEIAAGMAGLVLVVCFSAYLLIYNILYLSVSGNIRYYGLMQTVGMTEKQIYQLIQKQMVWIGGIGIAGGIGFGTAVSFFLIPEIVKTLGIRQADIHVLFHPMIFLFSIFLTAFTIYLSSWKPAKMAMQISPVEAMGYRGISGKRKLHKTGKGNVLWRMAKEQLTKDKKKSMVVILSLGASLSVFLCLTTLIESQGARTIVSNYMDADMVLYNDTVKKEDLKDWKQLFDDDFFKTIKKEKGIKEAHAMLSQKIIVPWEPDFAEIWMSKMYDKWVDAPYEKEDYQKNPQNYFSFLIGIDEKEFQYLNSTLEQPVSGKDFKAGKVCILYRNGLKLKDSDIKNKKVKFLLDQNKKESYKLRVGSMTDDNYYANMGIGPTLIASDKFVQNIVREPYVSKITIQYKEEYDKETESVLKNAMNQSHFKKDFSYESKIDEVRAVKKAQGNMMGIGIGMAVLLAFIGVMNYINTVSGNIQSRQTEMAVMESVGMTEKQVKKMLVLEGILFAGSSVLFTGTIGLGITYFLYQSMNYRQIPFEIPVLPILVMILLITFICIVIPQVSYRMICGKKSIVERIRCVE